MALSGGADSACVLMLAAEHMGPENVLAVTCVNSHVFKYEIDNARRISELVGVEHREFTVNMPPEFFEPSDIRCYHCKRSILSGIGIEGFDVLFDGTNADDDLDSRPGTKALREFDVVSPLRELGLGKKYALEKCAALDGVHFTVESCKATRIKGHLTEELMAKVETFEDALRDSLPGIRFRVDKGFVEFKSPVTITEKDFKRINEIKRESHGAS